MVTKAQRQAQARARVAELKRKQAAADRRNRFIGISILGAVIAALVIVVVVIVVNNNRTNAANAVDDIPLAEVASVPASATADGGILLAADGSVGTAPIEGIPTLSIYFDYICPACAILEERNIDTFQSLVRDGTANVVLHPLGYLDEYSQGSAFSTRSAAALAWVADQAPTSMLAFHVALFDNQPPELTSGLSNDELADLARQAGVPSAVADGIASGLARQTFGQWVYSATNAALRDPALFRLTSTGEMRFGGTPTLAINGQLWQGNWSTPGELAQAVADAAAS
jgi:protein-disulfide isomerase